MILNCGLILLSTAQSVSQMLVVNRGGDDFCFTVDILVWGLLCMILGQIRSLGRFAHIANSAVWMNIAICIITMVGVAVGGPYYGIFEQYGQGRPYFQPSSYIPLPIKQYAIVPGNISDKIAGMNNMVFAWGGATDFLRGYGRNEASNGFLERYALCAISNFGRLSFLRTFRVCLQWTI
ncbi:hypothetical protein QA23_5146 [Saccharomyces cerevisiae Lalvin QA23]|nr:hypothetical protein QA23_5146 [Saccharomyces cerevisiae Lalvin QA23]